MADRYRMMADQLNKMKPGEAWRISRFDINSLPGLPDWAALAPITTGFDRVKESVFGSSLTSVWRFYDEPNGDITAYRMPEQANAKPVRTETALKRLTATKTNVNEQRTYRDGETNKQG
jgi:hypothetical protein